MIDLGRELADAIEAHLGEWILHCVTERASSAFGAVPERTAELCELASTDALRAVMPALRQLLGADIDEQSTTPLSIIRAAVKYPTAVLIELGVPPRARDRFAIERFPDDLYALTPANLGELGEDVGEIAISWGAAKAWEHKQRHAPRT
jgi:hypothetical protein